MFENIENGLWDIVVVLLHKIALVTPIAFSYFHKMASVLELATRLQAFEEKVEATVIEHMLLTVGKYMCTHRQVLETHTKDSKALYRCGHVSRILFGALTGLPPIVSRRGMKYMNPACDESAYRSFSSLRHASLALDSSDSYVLVYSIDSFKGHGGFGDHHAAVVLVGGFAHVLQSHFPDVRLQYTRFERSAFLRLLGNIHGAWDCKRSLPSYKHISAMGPCALNQLKVVEDLITNRDDYMLVAVSRAFAVPIKSVNDMHANVMRFVKQCPTNLLPP